MSPRRNSPARLRRGASGVALLGLTAGIAPVVVALPVVTPSVPHPRPIPAVVATSSAVHAVSTHHFALVGASWPVGTLPGRAHVEVRVRTDSGAWSAWSPLDVTDGGPDAGSADAIHAASVPRTVSEPLWVGDADRVQSRVVGAARPAGMKLTLVDPGTSPADAHVDAVLPYGGAVASASPAEPKIYTRADWGADESMRKHACPSGPSYNSTVKVGFIHHTDTPNGYSRRQVPRIIRSIYAYHVKSNGWCDIGYNYLVDRFGRIWEGRYGGINRAVIGAHTGGFNIDSFGASMIGNFTSHQPSTAMLSAVRKLFAWKLSRYYRNASGTARLVSAGGGTDRWPVGQHVLFHVIAGHRDAGNTTCPGNDMYDKLPGIRRAVTSLIGTSLLAPSIRPRSDVGLGAGTIVARAKVSASMAWAFTVKNADTGALVVRQQGLATPTQPIVVGWDRRDTTGRPVPPGRYVLQLAGRGDAASARPFSRIVTLSTKAPAHPPADVFGTGWSALVAGAPGRTVDGVRRAGAVVVTPSSASGLATSGATMLTQNTPGVPGVAESGDGFGTAVATGDFNRDGYADIVVGVPGEDLSTKAGRVVDAGAIEVVMGGPDGPQAKTATMLTRGSTPGAVQAGALFGRTLAVGDLNGDGYSDLVVGAPGDPVNGTAGAGDISIVPGSTTGLDPTKSVTLSAASPHVPTGPSASAGFGSALATGDLTGDRIADVVVGVPGLLAGGQPSGAVVELPGASTLPSGTSSSALSGATMSNDGGFGSALAIGRFAGHNAPAQLAASGVAGVTVVGDSGGLLSTAHAVTWTEGAVGIPGGAQKGDGFGAALAAADLTGDGITDLAIGVPNRTDHHAAGAGRVVVLHGGGTGLTAVKAIALSQATHGVPGVADPGDHFGAVLRVLVVRAGRAKSLSDLVVAAPDDTVDGRTGAGAATVFIGGSNNLLATTPERRTLAVVGRPTAGDRFGLGLGG